MSRGEVASESLVIRYSLFDIRYSIFDIRFLQWDLIRTPPDHLDELRSLRP